MDGQRDGAVTAPRTTGIDRRAVLRGLGAAAAAAAAIGSGGATGAQEATPADATEGPAPTVAQPVYVLIAIRAVHDEVKLQQYREQLDALLGRYGGRRIAAPEHVHVLEGAWRPARLAIYEFASMAQLQAGYASPEYQPLLRLRQEAIDGDVVVVEGLRPSECRRAG